MTAWENCIICIVASCFGDSKHTISLLSNTSKYEPYTQKVLLAPPKNTEKKITKMGIRDISEQVMAALEKGRTKTDIFESLAASMPSEAGKIAYCIASVPQTEMRKKYLFVNAILCILLVAYSLLNAMSELPVEPGEPTLFIVLTSLISLVFSYFVFRFHGGVYRLAGIWFLIDLLENILLTGAPDGLSALILLVLFAIVVLSFLIARKVFPNLGILGPKKDVGGKYLL